MRHVTAVGYDSQTLELLVRFTCQLLSRQCCYATKLIANERHSVRVRSSRSCIGPAGANTNAQAAVAAHMLLGRR